VFEWIACALVVPSGRGFQRIPPTPPMPRQEIPRSRKRSPAKTPTAKTPTAKTTTAKTPRRRSAQVRNSRIPETTLRPLSTPSTESRPTSLGIVRYPRGSAAPRRWAAAESCVSKEPGLRIARPPYVSDCTRNACARVAGGGRAIVAAGLPDSSANAKDRSASQPRKRSTFAAAMSMASGRYLFDARSPIRNVW
jgi:hypothetical protein